MLRVSSLRAICVVRSPLPFCYFALAPTTVRYSSFSAIHRGLRRSENIQYGESRPHTASRGRTTKVDKIIARTQKALGGVTSDRKRARLLKKLDKKEKEKAGEGRKQTRRKRFVDENSEFGKKSVVWQLKHGPYKKLAEELDQKEPVRPHNAEQDPFHHRRIDTQKESFRPRNTERDSFHDRRVDFREERRRESGIPSRPGVVGAGRHSGARRGPSWREQDQRPRENPQNLDEEDSQPRSRSSRPHAPRDSSQAWEEASELAKARKENNEMMPMKVKYTTAASQFLYGKSVVKSALENGRRKFYKLYIQGGEKRQDSREDEAIRTLAHEAKIPITIVPAEEQQLMDSLSKGRPHNGYMLEASPLPQSPVKALGRLGEKNGRFGFHVQLDHQSKELEAVNGSGTFVERATQLARKPFVLLLNEILDPGNLGAILRTASYVGVDAVAITSRSSANLSPIVLKAAAGAVEELTLLTVKEPMGFVIGSRAAGWKTYAAVPPPDKKLAGRHLGRLITTAFIEQQNPLNHTPCLIVLGNEGYGLSRALRNAADFELSIPRLVQDSCVDSLNVSVAAGLLCHSFVKNAMVGKMAALIEEKAVESRMVDTNTTRLEEVMF